MRKKNLLNCINFKKRNLADSKDGDDINLKGIAADSFYLKKSYSVPYGNKQVKKI